MIVAPLGLRWRPRQSQRIPTEHLDKNAKKLPDAIKKVVDYRQAGKVDWRKLYYEE